MNTTRVLARILSAYWMMCLRWDAWRWGGTLHVDRSLRIRTRVMFQGRGTLVVGRDVVLGDTLAGRPRAPIVLAPRDHAEIVIGARTRLTNGVEMTAVERIETGTDCLIGSDTRIMDCDFHGIDPRDRGGPGRSSPVVLGDNVWIGVEAIILKGVRIGSGAVVSAGAVVVNDVAADSVVLGNPARVVASATKSVSVSASG